MSDEDERKPLEPQSSYKKPTKGFAAYLRFFTYADSLSIALYVVAAICLLACGTALPILDIVFGKFVTQFNDFAIGRISKTAFQHKISDTALILVYICVAKLVLFYIGMNAISVASLRTSRAFRIDYVDKTLRQEIAYFDGNDLGSIAMDVTTSGNLVSQGTAEKLGVTLQALSTFITAFVVALATQWKLSLITMCVVPAIVITSATCITIDAKQESRVLKFYSAAGTMASEALSSIRMVHAFWGQPKVLAKYQTILDAAEKEGRKKSINYGVLFSMQYFCVLSGYALAFWEGIRLYSSGEITQPGDVIVVIFAVLVAATSITQVAPQIAVVAKSCSAAENLFKVIDREPKLNALTNIGQTIPNSQLQGRIEFRDVHFAYPSRPDTTVLNGLTISFPANKTTALVGASGSGKSTIVGLLERWYDRTEGSITLDGVDITELDVKWLRTQARLVQQEPVLFNASVFENVRNGIANFDHSLSGDAQLRLVKEACVKANAHEFICALPQGYHTKVGERAGTLSGGQKQRIAIARSIVSNPRILLLDEATSALDPVAEGKVQAALDAVRQSRTTIMIAHKLSTVREADNIAVIERGTVVEQGTHEQLIATRGAYYRLVAAQDLGNNHGRNSREDSLATTEKQDDINEEVVQFPTEQSDPVSQSLDYGILHCVSKFLAEQRNLWPEFMVVCISCVVGGLTYPVMAILISRLINSFNKGPSPQLTHDGNFYSLMLFITALINLAAYFSMGYVTNIVSQRLTRRYRSEILESVLTQDISFFDEQQNTTGAIVSRLSTAPTQLQELLGFNVAIIFITLVNLVSTCILALIVGWKLALVVLFGALLPIIISAWLRFAMESRLESSIEKRFAASAAIASESVAAIRTVASLTLEDKIVERYSDCLTDIVEKSGRSFLWINFFFSAAQAIVFAAMALTFWYGAQLVLRNEYTQNQFFIIFIAVLFSGEACVQVSTFTTSLSSARSGANYILWLRQQRSKPAPSLNDDKEDSDNEKAGGPAAINVIDLEFAYKQRSDVKVIEGVQMQIEEGEFVACVGASGCGKSTMVSLLERFYDATSGRIEYNSTNINELYTKKYRHNIALVQQEPTLLSGTLRENIAFGLDVEPTDEQVEDACKQANIWDFVTSLPDGLATNCGSSGTQLSGGQRQRIAIARALIRNPRLLLLDEATSALDTESERIVQAAIEKASRQDMTTVAIAHRLSTIKGADRIFVFSNGQIVESGDHKTLTQLGGMYYNMCLSQSLE
ncbi:multidrug resistance protein 3 [Aureobasidium pullulans]|uniref:Multidrug resistance protein 3 n=1 Tax=Aureobasidium pullulans TaxID=5580 RepID=A0A4S8Z5V9_AURPU|nr:multidrug resistance protein 3 [Aureobasidium pullulans]